MRRHWSLIRAILLAVRDGDWTAVHGPRWPRPEVVSYHRWLVVDGGLVHGEKKQYEGADDGPTGDAKLYGLTMKGHDFLEWAEEEAFLYMVLGYANEHEIPQTLEMLAKVADRLRQGMEEKA